jgi:hypothetical protein
MSVCSTLPVPVVGAVGSLPQVVLIGLSGGGKGQRPGPAVVGQRVRETPEKRL